MDDGLRRWANVGGEVVQGAAETNGDEGIPFREFQYSGYEATELNGAGVHDEVEIAGGELHAGIVGGATLGFAAAIDEAAREVVDHVDGLLCRIENRRIDRRDAASLCS